MKYSLTTSLLLHAAILIAALVTLPEANPYKIKPQEAVMVDISKISDTTKQMAMTKAEAPKPVEKPAPKKAEVVKKPEDTQAKIAEETKTAAKEAKAAEPPPPEPDALKELIKETVAEEPAPKKEKPKKEEVKKAEVKPKEKPKPEKKKPELDVAKLEEILNDDAFLNKENEEKTTDASIAATDGNPAARRGQSSGDGQCALRHRHRCAAVAHPGVLVGAARRARGQYHRQGPLPAEHRRHRHRRAAGDE